MRIKYNPTRIISTADLFIACDPPIQFEVKVRLTPEWAIKAREWDESEGEEIETAIELMSEAFLNVSQDSETFPLNTIKAVKGLRDSIEKDNPGYGNEFIKTIVEMFSNNHFRFLAIASHKSALQSGPLNGTTNKKKQVA